MRSTQMIILNLRGTPKQMGEQHGEEAREAIVELSNIRTELILEQAQQSNCSVPHQDIKALFELLAEQVCNELPEVAEEMLGVSRAARISPGQLLVAGGYTDVKDILFNSKQGGVSECTTIIARTSEAKRCIIAGTWDTHGSAQVYLTITKRYPTDGPSCLTLTSVGWPAQQGVNEEGVVFTTANLTPPRSRIGIVYIAVLAEIARHSSLCESYEKLKKLTLASGHYYALGDASGNILAIETTSNQILDIAHNHEIVFHTNHYLAPEVAPTASPPTSTSLARLSRIKALVSQHHLSDNAIWAALSDHEGEPDCVCRHGLDKEQRSCAAYLINASNRSIDFTYGPACTNMKFHVAL